MSKIVSFHNKNRFSFNRTALNFIDGKGNILFTLNNEKHYNEYTVKKRNRTLFDLVTMSYFYYGKIEIQNFANKHKYQYKKEFFFSSFYRNSTINRLRTFDLDKFDFVEAKLVFTLKKRFNQLTILSEEKKAVVKYHINGHHNIKNEFGIDEEMLVIAICSDYLFQKHLISNY